MHICTVNHRANLADHFLYHDLAGVGFIGRHLAAMIVEDSLASHVRVVDKAPPATGWMNAYHKVHT